MYDFETLIRREGMGSGKWDEMKKISPEIGEDVVPLSVADMELKNPPEIIEGLKEYLDNVILGYTGATDAYYDAVINWMTTRHNFTPKKEWIVEIAGIVPAIKQMVAAFTGPDDAVLITPPVYHPFKMMVEENNRKVVESPLKINGNTYDIDFEDFEAKAKLPEVTMFILCSPHNPVGRIWTKEELEKISKICLENGVFIISDEIHFDLVMPGFNHVSMGEFEHKYLMNTAICTAPSKTFNLAGFQTSNLIIANEDYRNKLTGSRGYFSLNILGYKACELAYNKCANWLDELCEHINKNKKLVENFMAENMPEIKVFDLQGTYLHWLDFNAWGLSAEELEEFMQKKAYWFMDEGYVFGTGGHGYERINLACPTWVLEKALNRLLEAKNKYIK